MKKRNILSVLVVALLLLTNCTKVEPYLPPVLPDVDSEVGEEEVHPYRLIVANEGQFGYGTASLTGMTRDGQVWQDLFRSVNERPLGDVAQSVMRAQNKLFVTLNNSRKIEIMDDRTFKSIATVLTPDGSIPTYMAYLGGDSIVVSEKGQSGRLLIVDTKEYTVTKNINIGAANQMLVTNNKLFVGGGILRIFDINNITESGMRKILLDDIPLAVWSDTKILTDKNGKVWIFNQRSISQYKLYCIDPDTETILKVIDIPMGIIPSFPRIDISPDKETIYVTGRINNVHGILAVNINDTEFPTELLFSREVAMPSGRVLYNMAVSKEGTIFICDVVYGSLARGFIHEFSPTGELLNTFEGGIFPQFIYFF